MKSAVWMKRSVLVIVATVFAAACGSNATVVPNPASPSPPAASSPTVTVVTVSGAQGISSSARSNAQMTASAQFSDSTARDVTSLASWASSNSAVATISSTGMVTVVGTGDVELRATYQSVVGAMRVAMTRTFVLTGVVRDASTQLPLAGVRVQMVGDSEGRTTTGQGGAYMLEDLPEGFVEFTTDGYDPFEMYVAMESDQHMDVSLEPSGR